MFDYPIFEMPVLGHRLLFALDAVLHVLVSHGAAVGASIVLATANWYAARTHDTELDELVRKLLMAFFIVSTAVGALTGIGIWVHANIINPPAIGTLLRVFFWKWFVEWIVFNAELVLLLYWFLKWEEWSGEKKKYSIRIGIAYAVSSWLTMAIITAILGFMMTPGNWLTEEFPPKPRYLESLFNPSWMPSLAFRTFSAVVMSTGFIFYYTWLFTRNNPDLRERAYKLFSKFMLGSIGPAVLSGYWYYEQFPPQAKALFPQAITTTQYLGHKDLALAAVAGLGLVLALLGFFFFARPRLVPFLSTTLAIMCIVGLTAVFERVREFSRKPYIIYNYMYAHGIRVDDVPLLNRDGILKHAAFVPENLHTITPANELEAGRYVYLTECKTCHTLRGVNPIVDRVRGMSEQAIFTRIGALNSPASPWMPPFVGTDAERRALARFLRAQAEQPAAGSPLELTSIQNP
jgi:Cytochrome C oxidase, cbb3-type, subunit III